MSDWSQQVNATGYRLIDAAHLTRGRALKRRRLSVRQLSSRIRTLPAARHHLRSWPCMPDKLVFAVGCWCASTQARETAVAYD